MRTRTEHGLRIGIDVGGTFTDFLVVHPDGSHLVHKTSSVPSDPSRAVVQGLREIADLRGQSVEELLHSIDTIVHGTTVTTNALLTRRGAVTGLLTTEGFRDVLPMRDGTREEAYNNRLEAPIPLVPRHLRLPVPGRLDHTGAEVTPVDLSAVKDAAETFRAAGVEAVAISFMHSHADSAHEDAAAKALAEALPDVYVTRSSALLAQVRYYDRTSTAVLNSYAGPIISRYLVGLTATLEEAGFGGILLLMQSNGGVATPAELARRAALSLLSGPASGPTAGLIEVEPHGWDRCLTVDMGGTSFDAAVVNDGKPLVMTDGSIDRWRIALPMVDIHTIGAGGGSIARVDDGGMLRVGPESAGAVPGPACYGRGGTQATVTDADVVLGYIDPSSFMAGGIPLDAAAARAALERDVARPLGLDVVSAAAGVYDLVNVSMAAGVQSITVRRGLDPRDFPIVVAGGAGPVHAAAIASELEIPVLVTPRQSSIFCAAGMLVCDFKHDYVQSVTSGLADFDLGKLARIWAAMAASGRTTLRGEGIGDESVSFEPSLDMRYAGQWFEINVPVPAAALELPDREQLAKLFHDEHDALFGYRSDDEPIEVLNIRLTAVGATPRPALNLAALGGELDDEAQIGEREIWSPRRRALVPARVIDGHRLAPGARLSGPAVIELGTTSLVVLEEYDVLVDTRGSFVLYLRDRAHELSDRLGLAGEAVKL
ncbi:hydantoinase/oxoprolinase family protein [Saccharopolyspora sp. ASAGF58]|uniref:hydantoinase/oxoprolinase family protein n=1 Tax=Saccharopolyspora sp. ASAGF58 TaxID=2719023 RepID=UPI00143FC5E3|nr:hydantoinase/oxoprolinase family protein [Saccharopolyspora sp. ASAGF58]QIZ37324.1 hydantoinase/oxoprolinase family protein [Saccharopolyspora sp. ASAGF58]